MTGVSNQPRFRVLLRMKKSFPSSRYVWSDISCSLLTEDNRFRPVQLQRVTLLKVLWLQDQQAKQVPQFLSIFCYLDTKRALIGTGFDGDDGASLLMAFRGLQAESAAQGRVHNNIAKELTTLVADPFEDWALGYKVSSPQLRETRP